MEIEEEWHPCGWLMLGDRGNNWNMNLCIPGWNWENYFKIFSSLQTLFEDSISAENVYFLLSIHIVEQ